MLCWRVWWNEQWMQSSVCVQLSWLQADPLLIQILSGESSRNPWRSDYVSSWCTGISNRACIFLLALIITAVNILWSVALMTARWTAPHLNAWAKNQMHPWECPKRYYYFWYPWCFWVWHGSLPEWNLHSFPLNYLSVCVCYTRSWI